MERAEDGVSSVISSLLSQYPCFAHSPSSCPSPSSFLCGPSPGLSHAGFPSFSSPSSVAKCKTTLSSVCSPISLGRALGDWDNNPRKGNPPWCAPGACDANGVCSIVSNGTSLSPMVSLPLTSVVCEATSPFSSAMAPEAGRDANYSVAFVNYSDPSGLANAIPSLPAFNDPPIDWWGSIFSDSPYLDATICRPGLLCSILSVTVCFGGFYCGGDAFSSNFYTSPQGTYSPKGYAGLVSCGTLMTCDPGSPTPVQWLGAAIAAVAVILLALIYIIFSLCQRHKSSSSSSSTTRPNETTSLLNITSTTSTSNPAEEITFEQIVVDTPRSAGVYKRILHGVSGSFPQGGSVTAIQGPSGCGKSTLMNALMGAVPLVSGSVALNDNVFGFVPQADMLLPILTVRETLEHAVLTRLPSGVSRKARASRVDNVLAALKLTHVEHSLIGDATLGQRGISGGERRRVSIGIELLARPQVLFMDEITSGLDTTSALEVMQVLRLLADRDGTTIIAVLHQPRDEILELCDQCIYMAAGFIVSDASVSIAPTSARPRHSIWSYLPGASSLLALVGAFQEPSVPSGFLVQTWASFKRALLQYGRQPGRAVIIVTVYLAGGIILGFAFLQNHGKGLFLPPVPAEMADLAPAAAETIRTEPIDWGNMKLSSFFLSLALGVPCIASSIVTFGNEIPVSRREAQAGGSMAAYVLAKSLADLPFLVLGALVFSAVYIPMLRPASLWIWQFLVFAAISFLVYGAGYVFSLILPPSLSLVTGTTFTFGSAILAGISPKYRVAQETFSVLIVFWDLSFSRYAVEALVGLEAAFYTQDPESAFAGSVPRFATEYGFHLDRYGLDLLFLLLIGLAFRVLAWLILVIMHSRPR